MLECESKVSPSAVPTVGFNHTSFLLNRDSDLQRKGPRKAELLSCSLMRQRYTL